ncbi:MFS transporter [Snodgrassella alvi]|uniref:MFS transporter n=1 Tax=Snodgrassella alvi TaxID=1196083 RepID=UPI0034607E49
MQSQINLSPLKAHWSAVFSLFLGVTSLISAEFIPISLLTPIAKSLHITEGVAGQTVTAVGIFAVLSSLFLSSITGNINRRKVLLTLSLMLIIANILIAFALNYILLLIGRSILGLCVGSFWSLSSAVTMQLVPKQNVSRALSVVYAGVSVATIISLPLASYLGNLIGWRSIFLYSALLAAIAFIWQFFSLPQLAPQTDSNFKNMILLLKQPWVSTGMLATIFSYGGYHIFFTYLRPFLQHTLFLPANTLSMLLLIFAIGNFIGTMIAGWIMHHYFKSAMIISHIIFFILATSLFSSSNNPATDSALVVAWGFMFGFLPVGWSTWIAITLANKSEMMGGLSVAAIQFAIGLAAAIGGSIYDHHGINGIFLISALIFIVALFLIQTSLTLLTHTTTKQIL